MAHYLNREAMRVVERNDRGLVTYRKRYRRGDKVDVSHIDDTQVESLVKSGALVESEDDVADPGQPTDQSTGAPPSVGAAGDLGSTATSAPEDPVPVPEEEQGDTTSNEDEDVEEVDEFSSMDYAELQQAAKGAGLNAGGSAEDLRARLRENA